MSFNVIIIFISLYLLPLVLTYSFVRERIDSIPTLLIDLAVLAWMLVIAIAEHFRKPKIPNVKPLILIPKMKRVLLQKVLGILFTDVSKLYYFVPMIAGFHAVSLMNANYIEGIFVSFSLILIYAAILMASWITGITLRFAKTEESRYYAFLPSCTVFMVLLTLLTFVNSELGLYRYSLYTVCSVLLFWFTYRMLTKNIQWLIKAVFEPLNFSNPKIMLKTNDKTYMPLFSLKETRMCFRSKRIRILFVIVPVYATAVSIALLMKGNIQGFAFIPYFATTALAMNYNEYWEKYWAWDRNSHGLIFSTPEGKKQYFRQKIAYLLIVGSTVLPVHILFFGKDLLLGILGGLIFMCSVSIFTGYDSMDNRTIKADLNASIWTKVTFNIHFVLSLLLVSAANWYFLFGTHLLSLKILYVFVISVLIVVVCRKLYSQLQSKEWTY